jgi:hypothetical protein
MLCCIADINFCEYERGVTCNPLNPPAYAPDAQEHFNYIKVQRSNGKGSMTAQQQLHEEKK